MKNLKRSSGRERILQILDNKSFMEIGGQITSRTTDFGSSLEKSPSDGVITGYGLIQGNLVYVYSQDREVLGGSIGEMHAKKIIRVYEMAMKVGAPVIGFIDSSGLRIEESVDSLHGFGEIYKIKAHASGVIPMITAIFGKCGGGMSTFATLSDFVFMEQDSQLFMNSPGLIDSLDKQDEKVANSEFHQKKTGLVDFVGDEDEILDALVELITLLPANNEEDMSYEECNDNLNRDCHGIETVKDDAKHIFQSVSDEEFFYEIKPEYGKDMVIGFIRLNGITIGAFGNRSKELDQDGKILHDFEGSISFEGAEKAAKFINFCDAYGIPILSVVNAQSYKADQKEEVFLAKAMGRLVYSFANATSPKISMVTGVAYGSAYISMGSKSLGADIVYGWDCAKIGTMNPKDAGRILSQSSSTVEVENATAAYSKLEENVSAAAARGYVDQVISPKDSRKYLIGAYEMLFSKREDRPSKKHGTV